MYLFKSHDLKRAGAVFYLPVRDQPFHSDHMAHKGVSPCAWCHGTDSAWRRHLVTCPSALAPVTAMRDEALAVILRDVNPNKRRHHETALALSNMDHRYRVISRVTSDQRRRHGYTVRQPIIAPLRKALLYVGACLNA
jgi:hypothetical protein